MQAAADTFATRMKSYGLCGTPHVEIYGPDHQALARDTCTSRSGTGFAWDWITLETGAKPGRPIGGYSSIF